MFSTHELINSIISNSSKISNGYVTDSLINLFVSFVNKSNFVKSNSFISVSILYSFFKKLVSILYFFINILFKEV